VPAPATTASEICVTSSGSGEETHLVHLARGGEGNLLFRRTVATVPGAEATPVKKRPPIASGILDTLYPDGQ
jgi:hypothetical protein